MTQYSPRTNQPDVDAFFQLALRSASMKRDLQKLSSNNAIKSRDFPLEAWRKLASKGLLRHFMDNHDTANPIVYRDVALGGYLITRHYQSLGLTMTWVGQLLKCYFLLKLNRHDPASIDAILDGRSLCALAISEPSVGAHPKHLRCNARKDGNSYILNGEKAFVSHGPYADHFIVLAITEQLRSRNYFSAFFVPANHTGVQVMPPQPVKGLKPSSHSNIILTDCCIPSTALIGTTGRAFEEISLPMRTLEDGLMLAPIAGAIQAQLDHLANSDSLHSKFLNRSKIGELLGLADSAKELGIIAASKLDQEDDIPDLTPLIIGFRSLVKQIQTTLIEWHDEHPAIQVLANDIQLLSNIGTQATTIRTNALAENFLAQ